MFKTIAVTITILITLVTLGYFLTLGIGKPIHTDLSVIGQGKPALVLAYENYSPSGGQALNRLRKVRNDYDARLHFVVADLGTPEGHKFSSRYKILDGQAVFLTQDGQLLQVVNIPTDEQALRHLLETKLGILEKNIEATKQ